MRKVTKRAVAALLVAVLVIFGCCVYIYRYLKDGAFWAGYFGNENITSTSILTDRNGTVLATISSGEISYADSSTMREACYQLLGDGTGNISTGALSCFSGRLSGFSYIFGTTRPKDTSLELTVDADLQVTAYEAMGSQNGAVIACNYKTGEILCTVSTPAQDPLYPSDEPEEGTYLNKGISSTLTPGSTFKLVTLSAALETVPNIYSEEFTCEGSTVINGVEINCTGEHGTEDIYDALANSCNVAFAEITQEVGSDALSSYVDKLGFTSSHDINGIPTAAGSFVKADDGTADLSWSGIGQYQDLVCPFSELRLVSAIANHGRLAEPTLLVRSLNVQETQLLKASTADAMKKFMRNNVESVYGDSTFPGLTMCGKTGTAEVGDGDNHSWFTGFLDDEEHPYAIVVVVEHGGYGLSNAGAIANTVLQEAVANGD
jgi:peptidoglycan glycosyltransferase